MALALLSDSVEVGLVTVDAAPMVAFYEGFLGLAPQGTIAFPGGSQQRFGVGSTVIKIVEYDDPPTGRTTPGGGRAQQGIRYLTLGVQDLTAAAAAADAAGYELVAPLVEFEAVPGFGFLHLADPDGNWVELYGPTGTSEPTRTESGE